jgi:hypothetical protein
MSEFKIGDKVIIDWVDNYADGMIGTIVKKFDDTLWTVKIPGFHGHDGDIFDGTYDKRFISELHLTKLPSEKKSTFKFKPIVYCILFILATISTTFFSNHFGENSQENFQLMFKNITVLAFDIKCWLIIIFIKDFDF